jgi:hypothetical protein
LPYYGVWNDDWPNKSHETYELEQKAAAVEEIQGLLHSLEAQYQQDRITLEGAYLTQRRELEKALAATQQAQQPQPSK